MLSLLLCLPLVLATASQPCVQVDNGSLKGVYSPYYHQDFFLGIPYAEPPVGPLRFNAPEPYMEKYNDFEATAYGAACYNYAPESPINAVYPNQSEDCLTLNVVRPTNAKDLPVVVWLYGGGFEFGASSDERYNLSYIVEQSSNIGHPVIAASFNYRLGPFGFMSSAEILQGKAANAGLRDQRLALQWIHDNIQAFGGDPSKVTIMGESAGATSVGYQMLAYAGNTSDLFQQAIMESGSLFNPTRVFNLSHYQPVYEYLLKAVNCSDVSCLRNTSSEILVPVLNTAPFNETFQPFVDGDFLTMPTSEALEHGAFAHVPIIAGTNMDEGTIFTPQFAPMGTHNDSEFFALVNRTGQLNQSMIERFEELYPNIGALGSPYNTGNDTAQIPPSYGSQWKRAASFVGDFMFSANRRKVAQVWTANNLTAYTFRFDASTNSALPTFLYGVWHTTEIAFVLHNTCGAGYTGGSPFDNQPPALEDLATEMSNYWIRFIATGDPNNNKSNWPKYAESSSNILFSVNGSYVEKDDWRADQLEFINSMPDAWSR